MRRPAPDVARACGYGVIFSIGLSPRDNDEIWLGTDDGRVKLTRDAGTQWQDVTPPGVPAWSKISTVDVSPLEPGTAYIAVDNHRADDFRPMAWRTHDYGQVVDADRGRIAGRPLRRRGARRYRRDAACCTQAPTVACGCRSTTATIGSRCSATCPAPSSPTCWCTATISSSPRRVARSG